VALRIGLDGGSTPVVGPTLAPRRGRIVSQMALFDWPACAWISWPLMVAVVGFDFSLLVFRIVWRGLLAVFWIACFGRPRLVAEPRAPEGRLLPHISAGWDRIAASQRRNPVCPLWAGGLACVDPRWLRKGASMGSLKGRSCPPFPGHRKNELCVGSFAPSGLCRNTVVPLPGTGVDCTFPLPDPYGPPSFGLQGCLICVSGQSRENRYINCGAAGEGQTFLTCQDAPPLSLAEPLFFSVSFGFLASGILRGPVECRGANMPDPPAGRRGRGAPPNASLVTPAGRGGETGLRRTASAGGQTGILLRVMPPPPRTGVEDPPGRRGSSLMPTYLRSVLDTYRSEMLVDATRALSDSPRRVASGGQAYGVRARAGSCPPRPWSRHQFRKAASPFGSWRCLRRQCWLTLRGSNLRARSQVSSSGS